MHIRLTTKTILIGTAILALAGTGVFLSTSHTQNLPPDTESIVYESPAESASECSTFEKYDEGTRSCYFECADEAECAQTLQSVERELETWTDAYTDKARGDEEPDANLDKFIRATYTVSSDERISLVSGTDEGEYRSVWDLIRRLSPDHISEKYISEYQIFENADDDTQAFVDDADGDGKWRIAVNIALYRESSQKERAATLVHELGHIITLNRDQVIPSATACQTKPIDEGCPKADSYFHLFTSKFWSQNPKLVYDAQSFVTEYAATSDAEDIAESFAFYVLESENKGSDIKDQKIRFFATYPSLVTMRTSMRNELKKDIIRARKSL